MISMQIRGMDKIREKLPDYPGRRIALLPLRGLVVAVLGYAFLITMDVVPV